MRYSYFLMISLFLISCSTNKQVQLIQEYNENQSISIVFFNYDKTQNGNIILRKKIKLKNPYWDFCVIKISYFKKKSTEPEMFARPTEFNKEYNKFTNIVADKITIGIRTEKEIIYEVWENIDTLDFTNKFYKSLKHYKDLVKPTDMSSVMPDSPNPIDENILSYEEPYSEFKRKNPELLEFLTKGDTIELEVISPVKQKYRFKAEW